MSGLSDAAHEAIRRLALDLAAGDYEAIAGDGRTGRLTSEEVRRAVAEYGRTLIPLPSDAMKLANVYPLDHAPGKFLVEVPVWTAEEGCSDLTLSLDVTDTADHVVVAIDDLHVL